MASKMPGFRRPEPTRAAAEQPTPIDEPTLAIGDVQGASAVGPAKRSWVQKKRTWAGAALLGGYLLGSAGGNSTTPAAVPASTVTATVTASAEAQPAVTTTATVTAQATTKVTVTQTAQATATKTVTSAAVAVAPRTTAAAPKATQTADTSGLGVADTSGGGGTDPRFSSCKKAKAAGFGPYVQGTDPEYDWYRDADGDGVVCE